MRYRALSSEKGFSENFLKFDLKRVKNGCMTSIQERGGEMANREIWTIRGVDEEHRRKAKTAAADEEIAIGEWLEQAIDWAALPRAVRARKAEQKTPKTEVVGVVTEYVEHPAHTVITPTMGYVSMEDEPVEILRGHGLEVKVVAPSKPVEEEEKPAVVGKGRTRSYCQHGTEKGWNCWQCGGLAVIR